MWVILILIGASGEEPGWRGFALSRLQEGRSPLAATIIVAVFSWLWHLPLMWVNPAFADVVQLSFFAAFVPLLVFLLALGLLATWVYNRSGGSVLMPILLHFSWNFWNGAFGPVMVFMGLFVLSAVVVGLATKGKLGLRST